MAAKIRKGDRVLVLAGKDKGKTGNVLRVIPTEDRAVVQGINLIRRHTKQTPSQDAGIYTREAPIHLSNLALVDPNSGDKPKPTRVGFKINDDGTKVRIARASGASIDG